MKLNQKSIKYYFILLLCLIGNIKVLHAQEQDLILDLNQVIKLAKEQSFDALIAKHTYRSSYWQYRTYIANQRPILSLQTDILGYNRSINRIQTTSGDTLLFQNINSSAVNLNLNQNIPLTGGKIFIRSNLARIDNLLGNSLEIESTQYSSTPFSIGFSQPILSFNSLKWEKKIEPLKYEKARKRYINACEQAGITAANKFFDLILAQINLSISIKNYNNTDTLYQIAKGRFNIGTIAQNELMQMELSYLNAQTELENARLNLEDREFQLQSFLGFKDNVNITLIPPVDVPLAYINFEDAYNKALANNPQLIDYEQQILEAQKQIEQAKAENRFNADLFASYGLTDQGPVIHDAYKDFDNSLRVNVGLSVPILDWGMGKGRVKMAESNYELVQTMIDKNRLDFEHDLYLKIKKFNIENDQYKIASKADTIAQLRYEVTKQRFLIGKIDVLDLNVALTDKDQQRRAFISELRNYWLNYYQIRQITQFDFIKNQAVDADYENLIN